MKKRIIWNDLKANRLLSFSTWAFMAVSALLFALTCFLFTGLLGSIDVLMEKAETPDFLQMHAGAVEEAKVEQFVRSNPDIRDYQLMRFLNLENGSMTLGEYSLSDSTQDNGVIVQSKQFDYLVDMENQIIEVKPGEIYVPVCYRQEFKEKQGTEAGLAVGDLARIGEETFRIAGFLRDSQMNSMLSSSKRFLVCEEDYQKLAPAGSEEYLIEFLLREEADSNAFAAAYTDAGLPANGPSITRPLIRLMNALSDGLMVLVILLVSVVVLLISMLCIRFTLLDKLTSDRREIGMLKAVGIDRKDIRQIYFLKYMALSVAGAVFGLVAAYLVKEPLQAGMQELYGMGEESMFSLILPVLGVAVTEGILLLSIGRTLKKMEKMSAVEALTGVDSTDTGKRSYLLVVFVIAAGVFLMLVPQNLYSTISSKNFVTYMGIGNGEVRMDIRQTEDIFGKTKQLEGMLAEDGQVEHSVFLLTKSYRIHLPKGTDTNLNVEQGDHTVFPVAYSDGRAPVKEQEIALSGLCAEEFGKAVGDKLQIVVEDKSCEYTVCGIYSDITNGGKTAKAAFIDDSAPVMWSIFYVSLKDGASKDQWIRVWENHLAAAEINAKVVDIQDFVLAIYGQTMRQIHLASQAARIVAVGIILIVVFLFTRLMVAKDRNDISLRKALGFSGRELKGLYLKKYCLSSCGGILIGILTGNILGELLAGVLLHSLGASGFHFIVDAGTAYLLIPVLGFGAVLLAVSAGLREISGIKAYECCLGRE